MPKPHARATRAISPGHLPMMVRLLARISRNDLHWLNTLDAQELRALLQLIATAKTKRLDIATLLEAAVLHQSPDKRGVPLPVKMVSQLTQTWHSQVRSFC